MEYPIYKELRKSFLEELNHVSYFDNLPDNKCKFICVMNCMNSDCDVSKIVINYIYADFFQRRKYPLHTDFAKPQTTFIIRSTKPITKTIKCV